MLGLLRWISFTSVSVTIFTCYFFFTAYQIYDIIHPKHTTEEGVSTLDPMWNEGQALYAECYLSTLQKWGHHDFSSKNVFFVGNFTSLSYDWQDNERSTHLNITQDTLVSTIGSSSITENSNEEAKAKLWKRLKENGTVYLHVHVTHEGFSSNPKANNFDRLKTIHQVHSLIKYAPRQNAKNATFLLSRHFPGSIFDMTPKKIAPKRILTKEEEDYLASDPALTTAIISYWKPTMAIRLVTDFKRFPLQEIPPLVYYNARIEQVLPNDYKYMPSMYLDDMGLTSEKLLPLNRSIDVLPLEITYAPMGFGRWQMMMTMEQSLKAQEQLGFTNHDLDNLRSMIADTNPYLLALTMTVSMLHLLFDWLAFKSDISFWRQQKTTVGISTRSLVTSFVSQFIIFLYLMEQETTLLVLGPSCVSLLIGLWKLIKVYRKTKTNKKNTTTSTSTIDNNTTTHDQKEIETAQVDKIATRYMTLVLFPLIIGYAIYSLVYKEHTSWYSWVLGSLTGAVYAFGFIMMTPQLFINYKLKSVAHLPWKFMIYKALNTFIDDLFAFIIKMPTMHRISCFRDDVVFFIYLYQRWIYPVDKKRTHEDAEEEFKTVHTTTSTSTSKDPSTHEKQE